ncbi:MAG: type III pantothenate kinase [Cyanobacteriota bacterium]|nr:type III pantothenate kinase [Cyanobacteriota bacterium]
MPTPRWLLIGNSRWHWAAPGPAGLLVWHGAPASHRPDGLVAWAAVGPVPEPEAWPTHRRLRLDGVPLEGAPAWLGIDRALAAWQATVDSGGAPVLVADAGTVLSLTRLEAGGRFGGGRLLAGLELQLRAMAAGTALLPRPSGVGGAAGVWPMATEAAMVIGVQRGLAAAVAAAAAEAADPGPWFGADPLHLWVTGGDGPVLFPLIQDQLAPSSVRLHHDPSLCLRAMARLRPVTQADHLR